MALANPTYPDSFSDPVQSFLSGSLSLANSFQVTGDYTSDKTTEYVIRVTSITEGLCGQIVQAAVSGPNFTPGNVDVVKASTTTLTGSGTGLKVDIDIKAGAIDEITFNADTGSRGTGYVMGDTFKVLGDVFSGGATPANDCVFTIATIANADLKYRYKIIQEGIDYGWVPVAETVAIENFAQRKSIQNGLEIGWGSFIHFTAGEDINFTYGCNGTISSNMHVLNTKDGSHLLKYRDGQLSCFYNIDTTNKIDQNSPPDTAPSSANDFLGVLSKNSTSANFAKINSKSVSVGLGGDPLTPPKWVGLQQFKQWKREFNEDSIIIEDGELKVNTEIPQLDNVVSLDTANWYDSGGNKAGSASAWTQQFWAGFQFGKPDLYIFRVVTDSGGFSPRTMKVLGVTKYGIEKTAVMNPVAISTDGPNLFVLDKTGPGGLLHCFKFVGSVDSGEATAPKIEELKKYNSSWPYALPDTPRGIAILAEQSQSVAGGGAWYSDIMVTPSDSSMNTASGGTGRIWIQASWNFKYDRDYAPYFSDPNYTFTNYATDAWYPVICGHEDSQEWLWSINLANPAHPTGMVPDLNTWGRLKMDNRSPALDKFYKNGKHTTGGQDVTDVVIRGDYDIKTSTGSNPHPQANTVESHGDYYAWIEEEGQGGWLHNAGLSVKTEPKEAGVMQTLRFGLVDIQEATKVGVICLYAQSDKTLGATVGNAWGNLCRPFTHLGSLAVLYAEMVSSSAYYASSFVNKGAGASGFEIYGIAARDRLINQGNGEPKEVEVAVLPASQVPTFNIIDGTVEGFTQKPLIIPLAEDCYAEGYTSADANDLSSSEWGLAPGQEFSSYGRAGRKLKPTTLTRAVYNTDGVGAQRLVTFDKDGTIKTYDLSALYAANSLQTGTGANSWNKTEFFRTNPYDEENDNIDATLANRSASQLVPGGVTTTGDLTTATGFIQHPTANGMNFGQSGDDSRKVCLRDASKYEVDLYSNLTGADDYEQWENAYGGKAGIFRIMILPSELPIDKQIKINYNSINKATQWDFSPTSIYDGTRAVIFNQGIPMLSYVKPLDLDDGIQAPGTYYGFEPRIPYFTISGHDTVGNGVAPIIGDTSPARAGALESAGKAQFIGWAKKTFTPDGSTALTAEHLEQTGDRDYMYYAFSFIFDGHQESPLSVSIGSTVDTDSGFSVQKSGDGISIKISIPNITEISRRISHVNFYRSKNKFDPSYAKAFYQLIEQITLDDPRWVQDSSDPNLWFCTITDIGKTGETYETRTGVSELLENTQPHYGISCQGDGYLFISQAWHQTLDDSSNYIFRSKPGKHNIFDWSTDWCELPEYPTALGYYNGKLLAFSLGTTYFINPRTMTIEEDALQCGCLGPDAVISCDYGMVWADRESIWMYNGVKIINIGLPIEQGGDYSYRSRDRMAKVSVEFDSVSKCFTVLMKPRRRYGHIDGATAYDVQLEEISHQAVAWMYHAEKSRWDYWILKNDYDIGDIGTQTLSTCRDWQGGVLYTNNTGLYQLGTDKTNRKYWSWVSKNFVMGYPTLDKRFYKVRAVSQNGTPSVEYKVDDAVDGLTVGSDEKIVTKKGKRIKIKVSGEGETAVDSIGIIYRKPKAK